MYLHLAILACLKYIKVVRLAFEIPDNVFNKPQKYKSIKCWFILKFVLFFTILFSFNFRLIIMDNCAVPEDQNALL